MLSPSANLDAYRLDDMTRYMITMKLFSYLVAIPGVEAPARWILPKKLGFR